MKFGFIARHRDKLQLGECQILKRKKKKRNFISFGMYYLLGVYLMAQETETETWHKSHIR